MKIRLTPRTVALSCSVLERVKSSGNKSFTIKYMHEEETDCCAVCLAPIQSNGCETNCAHKFHTTCLLKSFSVNSTCPLCREELIPTNLTPESRRSRLESTLRTNTVNEAYRTLLQNTERTNETLQALHERWAEHETEYTAIDREFADHIRSMMIKIRRTRTYRALQSERALKSSLVGASKALFTREMERAIGDPPDGFVDLFLRDREVLGLTA